MVITVEIYKEIRKMRLNGMSQRQIAATLHIWLRLKMPRRP